MFSDVGICNLALGHLARDSISDFSEPTAEARACSRFFTLARDTLLAAYPWRFAGKSQALAEVTNDRPGEWLYAYNKPNDCLKIRYIVPEYSEADPCVQTPHEQFNNPYSFEGSTIWCNFSPAFLRYTLRLTDPTKFGPLFVDAFSWHLATYMAIPLTRDPKVRADCYNIARQSRATAETHDANEVRETSDHESDYRTARDS